MKQRRKNRQLAETVRSHFKSLCVPCVYPTTSINAKPQKEREKGWTERSDYCVIPYHRNHRQKITINSKVSDPGLKAFLLTVTCILAIIRADRKTWFWCVCGWIPLGREGNGTIFEDA